MSKTDPKTRRVKFWGPFFRPAAVAIGCWLVPMVVYGIVQAINDVFIVLYLILLYAASIGLFCYFGVRVGAELFNSDPISAASNALACAALIVCFETQGAMFYGLDTAEAYARRTAVLLSELGGAQDPLQRPQDKELQSALEKALKDLSDVRRKHYSRQIESTQLFLQFNRYRQTEPYIAFFKSIGIPADFDKRNHELGFDLNHVQLWKMGFTAFFRGDRVGVVFTTDSVNSTDITKFRASLLNTYLELF